MFENIIASAGTLFTINNIFFMFVGTFFGILVGAIPGLTGTMAVSLLVPVTYAMDPLAGLSMLCGIYNGAIYGGSISAILFRIPGTPAACATVFDGYPLTRQGKSALAMELSVSSSTFGGIFSVLMLLFIAPTLAKFALMFGPAEYFWVAIFGMSMLVSLTENSMIKGVISGLLGLFLSLVGMDPANGVLRFTFENVNLIGGIELVPVLIGLFALPEVFGLLEKPVAKQQKNFNEKNKVRLFGEFFTYWKTYIRGAIVGTIVGIIPAAGGNIASYISYDLAKRGSKIPESFGKGNPEGVVASEAANNAITGGSFVPLLTLGIPGSTTTAAIMGAFMIHGINLGPQLFTTSPNLVYGLMWALLFTNFIMCFLGFYGSKIFQKALSIPDIIVAPLIVVFAVIGCYSIKSNMFDVFVLILCGVMGYFFNKFEFPLTPMILGLILGPIMEVNLLRAIAISKGSVFYLFSSPFSLAIISITLFSLYRSISYRKKKNKEYRC
jgi:putative tricarboxylic transport membrane protein